MSKRKRNIRRSSRSRKTADKPLPAAPTRSRGSVELRNLRVTEEEVRWLIKLTKQTRFPFSNLKTRLLDTLTVFEDFLTKQKEMTARAKANAFYLDDKTGQARGDRTTPYGKCDEIAHLSAAELRALIDQAKKEFPNGRA